MPPGEARRYSFVEHLASALWLNHDPARCWLTMLNAYYDASGRDRQTTSLVVTGLLAREDQWNRFLPAWDDVLRAFDRPYLHMADFVARKPPYATWESEDERKEFIRSLIQVVGGIRPQIFCAAVHLADFELLDQHYRLREGSGGPYGLCALACIQEVEAWVASRHDGDRLAHVVEKGDEGQGDFLKVVNTLDLAPVTPKPKKDKQTGRWFQPFQPADMIAWEWLRVWDRVAGEFPDDRTRRSWEAITRMMPPKSGLLTRGCLAATCEREPERFPRR